MFKIGEFSRATHLTVKVLRHYDDVGLLVPADVDPSTGYRHYQAAQVQSAHLIKRLSDLDMPLPRIREVLAAPDVEVRDSVISEHLERMESTLARTQETVAALRSLLTRAPEPAIERRVVPTTPVAVAREVMAWDDGGDWLASALASLHQNVEATGPDGAVFEPRFFEDHLGEVIAFVPVASSSETLSAARFAVVVQHGTFDRLDESYGVVGSYVTTLGIDAGGASREHSRAHAGAPPTATNCRQLQTSRRSKMVGTVIIARMVGSSSGALELRWLTTSERAPGLRGDRDVRWVRPAVPHGRAGDSATRLNGATPRCRRREPCFIEKTHTSASPRPAGNTTIARAGRAGRGVSAVPRLPADESERPRQLRVRRSRRGRNGARGRRPSDHVPCAARG